MIRSFDFVLPLCPCTELLINTTQVTYSFCKEFRHLLLGHVGPDGDVSVTTIMQRLFDLNIGGSSKAAQNNRSVSLSQAYHRYALNYINALNYLESLRRHQEFCDFEKVRQPQDGKWKLDDQIDFRVKSCVANQVTIIRGQDCWIPAQFGLSRAISRNLALILFSRCRERLVCRLDQNDGQLIFWLFWLSIPKWNI